jgi:hypothetical protein
MSYSDCFADDCTERDNYEHDRELDSSREEQ